MAHSSCLGNQEFSCSLGEKKHPHLLEKVMHFALKSRNFTETLLIQPNCDCPVGALLYGLLPHNLEVLAQKQVEDFPWTLTGQSGAGPELHREKQFPGACW